MRAFLLVAVLILAGCSQPTDQPPETVTATTTVTTTATRTMEPDPDCDDPLGPDPDCPVPGCQFHSVWMEHRYAAAGVSDPSWVIWQWDERLVWADLQKEDGKHNDFAATGEGLFGIDDLPNRITSKQASDHATLAWSAAPDPTLAATFCTEYDDASTEESETAPWEILRHTSDFVEIRYAGPTTPLGEASCALWHQTWTDAGVDISGGHHGNLCPKQAIA